MTRFRSKRPRLRLNSKPYRKLWQQVLERDRWQCQNCGRLTGLQVHHIHARSHLGDDGEENLITLCVRCHAAVHGELT